MSTISQTPKVSTVRALNNRNLNLLVIVALVVALVGMLTSVVGSPAAKPIDQRAYMLYRQGEWLSVPIRVSNAEAYQIFRRGEVASPLSNAESYKLFRKGEVVSIPILTNEEAYHLFRLGEWASVNVPASSVVDMTAYHLSERTLVDPQAGMGTYFQSERTSIPVRNLTSFNQYQISEWFGK